MVGTSLWLDRDRILLDPDFLFTILLFTFYVVVTNRIFMFIFIDSRWNSSLVLFRNSSFLSSTKIFLPYLLFPFTLFSGLFSMSHHPSDLYVSPCLEVGSKPMNM